MHLKDTLGTLDYDYSKGLRGIVVNVRHMVLEGYPLSSPHDFFRFKPQLLFKLLVAFFSTNQIPISVQPILINTNLKNIPC